MSKAWLLGLLFCVSGVVYSNAPEKSEIDLGWSLLHQVVFFFTATRCADNLCGFVKSFTEIGLDKEKKLIAEYHNSPWRFWLNWLLPENLGGKDLGARHKVATQGFNTMYNALWYGIIAKVNWNWAKYHFAKYEAAVAKGRVTTTGKTDE